MTRNYNIIYLGHITKHFDANQSIALYDLLSMSYVEMIAFIVTKLSRR